MKQILRSTLAPLALLAAMVACAGGPKGDVIPYTSDMCAVTDNKLGSMGDPIVKVYGNQEVKFCCRPCVKEFEADLEQSLAKLRK